ncbi:MAG: ATP-binding protein [Sedimenticola sp.]|nr:ATP-binding protein [Sedimenticola sp.]
MSLLKPRTLFGRTLVTIAIVSIGFQIFMMLVIGSLMLVPLGQRSADDLAALMVSVAENWQQQEPQARRQLESEYMRRYQILPSSNRIPFPESNSWLPYRFFLQNALSRRSGEPVRLLQQSGPDRGDWFWVDIPLQDASVRVGFPRSRIGVHPPIALVLVLSAGAWVTVITVIVLVRRLSSPLESLSRAVRTLGTGEWPEPVSERGPEELASLARSFNRMTGQVRELLANRTTLLAGISHDLRTPITQIQLALEMLPDEGGDPHLMAGIRRDLERINRMIGLFLDISRGLEGGEDQQLLIEPMLNDLAGQYRERGADVSWSPCPGCCQRVNAMALNRILSNLLDNALRYGAGTPIALDCRCIGSGTVITVSDQGPGIPESERERVFQPFHRLEQSRNKSTGGSGLGLAIVRQLAHAYGWEVSLESNLPAGTRAVVTLRNRNRNAGQPVQREQV